MQHGVYRIYWDASSTSVAVVGSDYSGRRWFACSNWTAQNAETGVVQYFDEWEEHIEKIELITTN